MVDLCYFEFFILGESELRKIRNNGTQIKINPIIYAPDFERQTGRWAKRTREIKSVVEILPHKMKLQIKNTKQSGGNYLMKMICDLFKNVKVTYFCINEIRAIKYIKRQC